MFTSLKKKKKTDIEVRTNIPSSAEASHIVARTPPAGSQLSCSDLSQPSVGSIGSNSVTSEGPHSLNHPHVPTQSAHYLTSVEEPSMDVDPKPITVLQEAMGINPQEGYLPVSFPASPSTVQPLLCPPKSLVECVFPDAVVFPISLWTGSETGGPRGTTWTVAKAFNRLCVASLDSSKEPLYNIKNASWTPASCAPDFLVEHHEKTESDFAKFLNMIVAKTVTLIGANPENVRMWSAESLKKMQGSVSVHKPDVVARAQGAELDWRNLDCVVEMQNGKMDPKVEKVKDRQSWCELAERAKFLFGLQHDRRFTILLWNKRDTFSCSIFDRGGSITSPFHNIQTQPLIFYHFVIAMSFAERRHIGYDTSIYRNPTTGQQRIILDMANITQGLDDLEVQLVLHMTGKVAGRGSTIRLLKVADHQVANFYGVGGEKYLAPPGMKPGDRDFGIICKDSWEVPHLQDLSEGMIIQLLHVKGVRGVIWCLDEKPVLAPDAPSFPDPTSQGSLITDNTMYTRSRWGIRALGLPSTALNTLFKEEERILRTIPTPAQPASSLPPLPTEAESSWPSGTLKHGLAALTSKLLGKPSKCKAKGKAKDMNPSQLPSLSTDSTLSSAAPTQSSTVPSPTSYRPIVLDDHHATRCHVRSYLYPVGTPLYWFGNILELLCVLRDLVRTHQEACSVSIDERKKSFGILHRDLSLWNFAMVSQARSDWPVDREWRSSKLKDCWEDVPEDIRSKIRRGLLIDWGFAAIQGTTGVELTEEDIMVYPPVKPDSSWLMTRDVTFDEAEVWRHYFPGVCSSPEQNGNILPIPPLWIRNEDTGKLEVNHYTNVYLSKAANEGQLDYGWVNAALRKQEAVSTTATGTWPFISFEVMAAWLLCKKLEIQSWHDLETIFISFTALCIWFRTPLHAKDVDHKSEIAWIFQSYSDKDNESFMSMYSKWEMFGPLFQEKILGNLSPYFNCPAITVLLTEMRDLCIPHSWGEGGEKVNRSPDGYTWPEGQPRVTHSKMLDVIEKAILTLVQNMDHSSNLDPVLTFDSLENPPKIWDDFHAKINSDGIFLPAAGATVATALLPVVVDSHNHTLSKVKQGLYYRVNPIGIDTRVEEAASMPVTDQVLTTTRSSAYSGKEEFCDHLFKSLRIPRKRADSTTDDMMDRFATGSGRVVKRRLDTPL